MNDDNFSMHIVIDGTNAINDLRAIKRYTWHLIEQIAVLDSEHQYTALYLGCSLKREKLPGAGSYKIRTICSSIPGKLLILSWKIFSYPDANFFIREKFDVLHFTGGYVYFPVSDAKKVTTIHAFAPMIIKKFFSERMISDFSLRVEKTISKTDYFITVSETNKQELNKLWNVPLNKITAIPLGVGAEFRILNIKVEEELQIRHKYSLGDKDFILYVGAIEPHKNVQGIIEAYSLLDSNIKRHLNLVFVGAKTNYTDSFIELAKKRGLADNIMFIDYIQPGSDDLAILYNLAELFIFPSFYEGWASPPLEAMKCGTPVIVSDIPSLRESTGGIAEYCNPEEPKDIAEKIKKMLEDCEFRRKKIDDGLRFSSQFTWELCAKRTVEVYSRLNR